MMARHSGHPASAILRAVADLARIGAGNREKPIMIVEDVRSTDWASITFTGHRHEFDLRFEGDANGVAAAVAHLGVAIGEHEIALAGHFVAEIAASDVDDQPICATDPASAAICTTAQRVQITALTILD